MKPTPIMEFITPDAIQNFARKNYKTYVTHCEARKLKPMQLTEFLKNYVIQFYLILASSQEGKTQINQQNTDINFTSIIKDYFTI